MPSVCPKLSKSHNSNVKANKINNDNNNSNNNNDDDSNNSVWNHCKSIVGKALAPLLDYSFFPILMTLGWGGKLIPCFLNWLLFAFFAAQSFTIIHFSDINILATTICVIVVIFVDEMWSSVWKPLVTVYTGCRPVRHHQQQQSFFWHYSLGGSVTSFSNGVIIELRPCALGYFYSKVSSFSCSFFLVLLTMILKLYGLITHLKCT